MATHQLPIGKESVMPSTQPTFEIVAANASHAMDLAHMNAEFNDLNRDPAEIAQHLENGNEIVLVAVVDGQAIGFICAQTYTSFCYDHPYAEIMELYIRQPFRRKGIGLALLRAIEQALYKQGVLHVKLLTGLNNIAAWQTYQSAGYTREEHDVVFSRKLTLDNR
ncbi:GNAT family N-acetyltransferase [Paenibacillus kandeliae]|uniref:GNAT family N-acetyltransferase n=1 Tax=Paenibacillus kandeliae TaxID=3231269 RepID=UPI00345A5C8A